MIQHAVYSPKDINQGSTPTLDPDGNSLNILKFDGEQMLWNTDWNERPTREKQGAEGNYTVCT